MSDTSGWTAGRIGRNLAIASGVAAGLALWSSATARVTELAVPQDGELQPVPGGRLHFTDTGGAGPVVVMLHGIYGQLRNFSYALTERLAAEARLILVDRPGWGWSSVEGDQPTLPRQARMVADFLAARDLADVTLVGHSMGGAVALLAGLDHPQRLRGLALIAPLTRPVDTALEPAAGLLASRAFRSAAAWAAPGPLAPIAPILSERVIFAPDPFPLDFPTRGGGALGVRPSSIRAGLHELAFANQMMAGAVPRYPALALPTGILYGRGDRVLDPEMQGARTAEAITDATLTLVDGGHMLPVTHPDATADWLRELLAR